MSKQKLELTWIGKEKRPKLESRILLEEPDKSYHAKHRMTDSDIFDNRLIFGDNLLALKALEQEFTGKVKFPTASEKRSLGTGEFDGTIQVEASKTFAAFTPFLTAGYRFVGNPPGSNLQNVIFSSVGFDYRFNARLDAGLTYEWRQTASPSVGDSQELSPYLSWKLNSHISLTPYAVFGLTRAATDAEIGFGASYRF